jgi:DNA-binding CsgD family transcriptional regulator
MSSRFVLLSRFPSFQPARFPLPEGKTTVGRSSNCQFVIRNETVSRNHAEILIDGETAVVRDLGSSNGTFLGGAKISECPFIFGQQIQFGQVGFLVSSANARDFEIDSTEETARLIEPEATATKSTTPHSFPLTPSQRRVLELLLDGFSEQKVAKKLKLSQNTVHTHVKEIYRACGAHSRAELLALFVKRDD